MTFADSLEALKDALPSDLFNFAPELLLCFTILLLLVWRMLSSRQHLGLFALTMTIAALAIAYKQWIVEIPESTSDKFGAFRRPIFSGMLIYDHLTIYTRMFLMISTALVIWLSIVTGIPDKEDSADFYTLLLGATVGMCIMASADHLLMVFIGIEMASLPSYALAGFLKGKRQSSEAALKYVVYGGGASGVMLYGISLLAGKFGTAYLPDLAMGVSSVLRNSTQTGVASLDPIILLGVLLVLIGFAFKLSAVPFHFWCPDVFEGAAAEVGGFLSVASKGAAMALTARFLMAIASNGSDEPNQETWAKVASIFGPALAIIAAVTTTFGNLAAYLQTNLKRLLAYSTIAHAGFMLMGLATFLVSGVNAVLFYLVAYAVMNLGAFAVVAFVRNKTGSEELDAYRGLIQREPVLAVSLSFFLFSLLGLPPLVGFAAKFQVFQALYDAAVVYAKHSQSMSYLMYALLFIGGVNTVFSLVYYVKVLKVMIIDKPSEAGSTAPDALRHPVGAASYALVMSVAVLVLGILWDPLVAQSKRGATAFKEIGKEERYVPAVPSRMNQPPINEVGEEP